MEEEKGGVLHILFIFIGITLLAVGVFYYFADDRIKLNEEPINTNNNDNNDSDDIIDEKDLISHLNIIKNVETDVSLKNGNKVTLKFIVDEDTNKKAFAYNGKISFETNELEVCDNFYIYNNSIIVSCGYGSVNSGHLYVIDSKGDSQKIDEFIYNDYRTIIPESIYLNDEKLIVKGSGVLEGAIVKIGDKEISICDENAVIENNVSLEDIAYADFEFKVVNDNPEFIFMKNTETLEKFKSESCKNVE